MSPKFAPPLLLLPLALALAATPPELHTFADNFGRTFSGTLLEATDTQIKVRRDDGQTFTLELTKLSEADTAYVAKWRREHFEYRFQIDASVSRSSIGSRHAAGAGLQEQTYAAGYEIKVRNRASVAAKSLWIEYNQFGEEYTYATIYLQGGVYQQGNQRLTQRKVSTTQVRSTGKIPLDLAAFQELAVRTEAMTYSKWISTDFNAGRDQQTGELRGLWVRVVADGKVVAEWLSSDNLRNLGWREVATAAPAGR